MLLSNSHALKYLSINVISININQVHFLSNTLKRSFRTKLGQISSDVSMSISRNFLKIHILIQFHVFGVNSQNFHSSHLVRNSNINFSVKSSESSQRRIDRVWSIGCSNNNHLSSTLHSIHQSQQLRNNSLFYFSIRLVSFWCD